jgi:hypothetical protein
MRLLRCIIYLLLTFQTSLLFSSIAYGSRLQAPVPHDTITIDATIPYNSEYGSGEAYVYLSDTHSTLTNPVVVIEGFDLDNNMNWDELYEFLNQEDLLETIRTIGFDAVVLNFADATDYIQKNAFVVVELIQQIQAVIGPGADFVLAGASMGGLVCRYALAYMETTALDHAVRNFISFDAPHNGANIPLGIQYWVDFFAGLSTDAADMQAKLTRPAARQMLVYHATDPPGSTGESDPLRADLLTDFAAVGQYPANCRKVAVANGSGSQVNQGFAAGDQIIDYEYSSFLVDIIGNVWAVPDGTSQLIFDGLIDIILLPQETMTVTVSGTIPYDNAPGGFRTSMAQMDSTEAPYGDIIALHNNHCFIPTVSALALDVTDLFYDVAGDPNILDRTPFDAVYYPAENQEHGTITAESAEWFLMEVRRGSTSVGPDSYASAGIVLFQNVPNPFGPSTVIRYDLPSDGAVVTLKIFDVAGRLVRTLIDGEIASGFKTAIWDGTDARGRDVSTGVYFYRLESRSFSRTKKMLLVK